jgi:hypothetical protein
VAELLAKFSVPALSAWCALDAQPPKIKRQQAVAPALERVQKEKNVFSFSCVIGEYPSEPHELRRANQGRNRTPAENARRFNSKNPTATLLGFLCEEDCSAASQFIGKRALKSTAFLHHAQRDSGYWQELRIGTVTNSPKKPYERHEGFSAPRYNVRFSVP